MREASLPGTAPCPSPPPSAPLLLRTAEGQPEGQPEESQRRPGGRLPSPWAWNPWAPPPVVAWLVFLAPLSFAAAGRRVNPSGPQLPHLFGVITVPPRDTPEDEMGEAVRCLVRATVSAQ